MNKDLFWSLVLFNSWILAPCIAAILIIFLAVALIAVILYFIFDFMKFLISKFKKKKKKDHEILEETKFEKDLKKWQQQN